MSTEEIPKTLEELQNKVTQYIDDPLRSVSMIYITYVRPFCELAGSFSDFLIPQEEVIALPPNPIKIRKTLFQIFILLEIFHKDGLADPLPEKEFSQILKMIRIISPLAMALDESFLANFLRDLETVHKHLYPKTIEKIQELLGLALKEPTFKSIDDIDSTIKRQHFNDSNQDVQKKKKEVKKLTQSENYSVLPHHKSFINHTVHVRIRRPKHGPNSKSKPSSSNH